MKGGDYSNAVRKLLSIVDCYDNIDLVEGANSLELLPRELSRFVKITSIRSKESADIHGNRSAILHGSGGNYINTTSNCCVVMRLQLLFA